MSIFNKLAKTNKNGLADKKRNIIGQYIKASKEVEKYEADKTSKEYKTALENAKEIYNRIFSLTPELQQFYNSNPELEFSEKHILGSDREDRTEVKDLTAVVERYLINSSTPKEDSGIDLSDIVKTMTIKVPEYTNGELNVVEDEDGNLIPKFTDMQIYSLGATQEEVNNSLKKLVGSIEDRITRTFEARLEEIEPNTEIKLDTDEIQEDIVKKSLEIVKQGLFPEIKKFLTTAEGQKTVKSSLAMDRLSNITAKYLESIRDMNIQDGKPTTQLGAFLMTEITNKKGEKSSGLNELVSKMYELVGDGVNKNPYLLDNYTGEPDLDLKFQEILHNTTDVALATFRVDNMQYNFPVSLPEKPVFVEQQQPKFANNMQQILDNTFSTLPGSNSYQEPALPSANPQNALPAQSEDNTQGDRVTQAINNTTSQYATTVIPKGTISINPGDLEF